jgi:hypothetical protein
MILFGGYICCKNYDKVNGLLEYLPLKILLWMCLDKLILNNTISEVYEKD